MKRASIVWLVLIQWTLAFEWLHSGWSKWSSSGFIDNIGKSLDGFASKTPYGAYGDFLKSTAIPNAVLFGNSIRIGEISAGLAMVIAGLLLLVQKRLPITAIWILIIALLGAALMNVNFFLAAGWSNPSTWGVNLIMAVMELILAAYYFTNRQELRS